METSLLCAAYFNAIYCAIVNDQLFEFTFTRNRFTRNTPIIPTIQQPWAIISAANPMSRPLTAYENQSRHARLLAALDASGLRSAQAWCRNRTCDWHEDSRLIPNCSRDRALQLAHNFDQRAPIWSRGGVTGLLYRHSEVWIVRPTAHISR
jgi:hypothetical protein